MMREIRSRRLVAAGNRPKPLYGRVLGLQYVNPGGILCFAFFEGTIVLAVLLALAEQVSWWAVLVLPATVAVMVKVNDVVAGALIRSGGAAPRAVGRATVRTAPAPGGAFDSRAAGSGTGGSTGAEGWSSAAGSGTGGSTGAEGWSSAAAAVDPGALDEPDDPVAARAARQSAARHYR